MTRSTDTITGITIETDGTLQVTDMRVDDFWTSRRITDGRGAALDAVRDYRLAAYPIGGNGRPGVACLLAGANHRFDTRQPENDAARAIVTRYGAGTDTPIRGRAVILAGWETDPRPILELVARELVEQINTDLFTAPPTRMLRTA
ncbi:hypothetical protein OPAG_08146 [Rhodococcus opacus PD630]|uniref:hypothetical protein n=1 Tax=Rhodococcus opacus TaxID=37919 RepID=UPI00029CB301|nr:hypothetical protein [Rhodococcus opacus]AHK35348.1 hypothetical protein Pd630_LPD09108 [Rhodococcus opacus PD630]EHI41327.1 hypothetical protein OPAG_08146 [Rhodococcus opacus PD630]UDH01645.1 hypothetical protein K2Z90_008070 [Rhodococcus opacus PD630]